MVSETPKNGTTEDWYFVNLTDDAQPVHLHLVQFQIVSRQDFDVAKYPTDWLKLNQAGLTGRPAAVQDDLADEGAALRAVPDRAPGRWRTRTRRAGETWSAPCRARSPGSGCGSRSRTASPYAFDPTAGPGYVWHCHIVDHEDNEMMRPMIIKK